MSLLTSFVAIAAIITQSFAFPSVADSFHSQVRGHTHGKSKRSNGILPNLNTEAKPIDISGDHAFLPPGHGDLRGPCPGLNALANHNYIPRNGVATIPEFIAATTEVFNMGLDLATFLANYGAIINGDLTSFSIGGPPSTSTPSILSSVPLLSKPQGLSRSHNKHETDGSPTRGDLYQYGNDDLLQMAQFKTLYNKQAHVSNAEANYDLDILNAFRAERLAQCKAENPYFFSAPFTGVAFQPATYIFIPRFFANHSAEHPEGVLNKDVMKSFFAISSSTDADTNSLIYTPGHERIPPNWYPRPTPYTIPLYAIDVAAAAAQYPQFLEIGGNTGTVDSFVGLDPADLTRGVYNARTLAQGNNALCFGLQASTQAKPDLLLGLEDAATQALLSLVGGVAEGLACPELEGWDGEAPLAQFPGYDKLRTDGTY